MGGACGVANGVRKWNAGLGRFATGEGDGTHTRLFPFDDDHCVFVSVVLFLAMDEESLTVIILYGGSKYGLFISRDASVLDVKREISVGKRVWM